MYIQNDGFSGYRGNTQVRTRGLFLVLVQPASSGTDRIPDDKHPSDYPIKCCVRKVALQQCGHWMMGRVNIGGKWRTVSGAYGSDGLPMTIPFSIYKKLTVELPAELVKAWNEGSGWNSCGSEADAMRKWANENLKALRK